MKMNYALYKNLPCKVVQGANPTILMKAIKNETEIKNVRNAELKDSVALTKFIYWLNEYHKECLEKLSPYMNDEERAWLEEYTREI